MVRTNSITTNETNNVMDLGKLRQGIADRLKDVHKPWDMMSLLYIVDEIIVGPVDMDNLTPTQLNQEN